MATTRWPCRFVAELALEFRQTFKRDVVIDMYCYRRYGHNEADDPVSTQPTMYAEIDHHPSVGQLLRREDARTTGSSRRSEDRRARGGAFHPPRKGAGRWCKTAEKDKAINTFTGSTAVYQPEFSFEPVETAVSRETLASSWQGADHGAGGLSRSAEAEELPPR